MAVDEIFYPAVCLIAPSRSAHCFLVRPDMLLLADESRELCDRIEGRSSLHRALGL